MSDARYRAAAYAYIGYGVVYWIGGMWLLSQGVGVMGGRTGGATSASMVRWGLIGLLPLIAIPALLWRRWSWLGGVASRRTFAWLIVLLLAARTWKVAQVALTGDAATVAAPWGGSVSFQAGALIFLGVTLLALVMVARAVVTPERAGASAPGSPRVQ